MFNVFNYGKPQFFNYHIENVIFIMMKSDSPDWWLEESQRKPWFEENEDHIKRAIIEYLSKEKTHRPSITRIFRIFRDFNFYKSVVDVVSTPLAISDMVRATGNDPKNLKGFYGGIDVDDLMTEYMDRFKNSANAITYLSTLIKTQHTTQTGKIFVELLKVNDIKDDTQQARLLRIKDINSPEVDARLY